MKGDLSQVRLLLLLLLRLRQQGPFIQPMVCEGTPKTVVLGKRGKVLPGTGVIIANIYKGK